MHYFRHGNHLANAQGNPSNRVRVSPSPAVPGRVQRRLSVIAFVDVAGWSSLVEANDVRAWRAWRHTLSEIIEPGLQEFQGRLLEVVGDAAMTEFNSAHNAVDWALEIQRQSAGVADDASGLPLRLRVGVHLADSIIDGDRRIGHGINVAARIHQWAEPGEIIASRAIVDLVSSHASAQWQNLGEQQMKNISQPVQLFRVTQ